MPLIEVTMVEGRTPEQLRAFISALTRAAVESVGAPVDSVRVVLREVPATHFAAGDVTIAERRARSTPSGATASHAVPDNTETTSTETTRTVPAEGETP